MAKVNKGEPDGGAKSIGTGASSGSIKSYTRSSRSYTGKGAKG